MRRFEKKTAVLFVIILCFIVGGTLSFESLARFTRKFEATKSVSSAKFEVTAVNTFSDVEDAMPGEEPIAEDKITLTNDNDYPVEFTVKLKSENKDKSKDLLQFLNLTITIDNEVKEIQDEYVIRLEPNTVKDIFAKIEWRLGESGEIDADVASEATAVYSYDIKAKQLSKDNSNSGENSGDENTESTTPGDGNDSGSEDNNQGSTEDSENLKSITLKDITWVATTGSNQSKIQATENYTIVGTNANAVLENLNFNLKEEKLIFNADIELLNTNDTVGKGLNFAIGVNESNDSTRNRLTYQLYKDNESTNKSIYGKVTNISNPLLPKAIAISGNGGEVIDTLDVKLTGEIGEKDNYVYAIFSIVDKNGKEIKSYETNADGAGSNEVRCGQYKDTDKVYIKISSIMGQEGIKINSMDVKAVAK